MSARTQSREQIITPTGAEKAGAPTLFSLSIPASFTAGQSSGNVQCADANTARVTLSPPMTLARDMEMHITSASIPYTQPNIAAAGVIPSFLAGDNRISIAWNGGARTDYLLAQGLYGFPDVELALNQIAVTAGWISAGQTLFRLIGIDATQKIIFDVVPANLPGAAFPAGGVIIDFLNPSVASLNDSIGPILGFPTSGGTATITIAGGSTAISSTNAPNVANFAVTSAYYLYMSLLSDSYSNGLTGKLLTQFPLGSHTPNSVFTEQPSLKATAQIVAGTYSSIDIYFTDSSLGKLPLVNFSSPISILAMIANNAADGSV